MKHIETPKISEVLKEEFMVPYSLSTCRLAKEIDVPVSRIQDLLHDRRKITAETSSDILPQSKEVGASCSMTLTSQA